MKNKNAVSVGDICNALGRKAIADAMSVRVTAVSNAVVDNRFPSKWYLVIKSLCDAQGMDCPVSLFSFEKPEAKPQPNTPSEDAA